MTARKLWGGRFAQETDPTALRFSASIQFDRALARYDIRGSIAHARMLGAVGIVSATESAELIAGLEDVLREIEAGEFPYDAQHEDIHMNIEARLREKIGAVAGKLHTGRSRNDQVATDLALFLRDAALAAQQGIAALRGVLLERAEDEWDGATVADPVERARIHARRGELDEARRDLRDVETVRAAVLRASIHRRLRDAAAARRELDRAAELARR
ncbi:MAG TPA: lyase family protein, partial [Myxococcota bacterium]|nr:lyase family protein [Myxococcota bacterium]